MKTRRRNLVESPAEALVDTDVIIRLLSGDDPAKQRAAHALFTAVEAGDIELAAPITVVADAVFVLSSPRLYGLSHTDVRDLLLSIVRLPGFKLQGRRVILEALDLYSHGMRFGDAMIVATMRASGAETLFSYDRGFDRVPGITRREPRS